MTATLLCFAKPEGAEAFGGRIGGKRLPAAGGDLENERGAALFRTSAASTAMPTNADDLIVWTVRTPRVVLAVLVGAGLSCAGVQIFGQPHGIVHVGLAARHILHVRGVRQHTLRVLTLTPFTRRMFAHSLGLRA
jgi:hypothetical protein